ncbi:MAG: ATP-binding protein [Treponema sp.]|nr:ATP-binding protein [Treponema sp.]
MKKQNNSLISDFFNVNVSEESAKAYDMEQDKMQRQNKIRLSEIPSEYQKGFNDYQTDSEERKHLLQVVQNCFVSWTQGKPVTVCLLGDCGIGKTKLGNAFLMESLNYTKKVFDIPVHYSIRYKLLDDIRIEYEKAKSFTEKKNQNQILSEYSDIDLLVIDEIGIGENQELQKTLIYKLMNERDLKKKTTIICSNFTFKEFSTFCGRPTMDRFKNTAIFPKTENIKSFRGTK